MQDIFKKPQITVHAYFSVAVSLSHELWSLKEKQQNNNNKNFKKTQTYPYSSPTHHLCFCIKARVWSHQIKIMFLCARKKQVSASSHQNGGKQANLGI